MQKTFEQPLERVKVIEEELSAIAASRRKRCLNDTQALLGLALSGGGIRSAAVSIGVLKALARRQILHHFDYLSSVSGGSYASGWLFAYLLRGGSGALSALSSDAEEPHAIAFVRANCSYLKSRYELAVVYFSGFVTNFLMLAAVCSLLLLIPRFWLKWVVYFTPTESVSLTEFWVGLLIAWIAIAIMTAKPNFKRLRLFALAIVAGGFLTTDGMAIELRGPVEWYPWRLDIPRLAREMSLHALFNSVLVICVGSLSVHIIATLLYADSSDPQSRFSKLIIAAKNGIVCGVLTTIVLVSLSLLVPVDPRLAPVLSFGGFAPVALVSVSASIAVFALRSGRSGDWVSGVAISSTILSWAFAWSFGWSFICSIVWRAEGILSQTTEIFIFADAVIALGGAAVLGLSAKRPVWAQVVVAISAIILASYTFAFIVQKQTSVIAWLNERSGYGAERGTDGMLGLIAPSWEAMFLALIVSGICIYYVSQILNSTAVPLNQLYASRLASTFLRASLAKGSEDMPCDVLMSQLSDIRPLPLINMTVTLPESEGLSVERGVIASFTVTPLHAGSDTTGYQPVTTYSGGLTLGRCVGVSGAAVTPTLGAAAGPLSTIAMTVLNLRLGSWFDNPCRSRVSRLRRFLPAALVALIGESFSVGNAYSSRVFVSDGGHFDNLGLYELIARKCKLVLLFDNSFDPASTCGDLADSIRKIQTRFPSVRVDIDINSVREHQVHYSVGRIHYGDREMGTLIYVKMTLTGDESLTITTGPDQGDAFPNVATANQFFSESQFERYRMLGEHLVHSLPDELLSERFAAAHAPSRLD